MAQSTWAPGSSRATSSSTASRSSGVLLGARHRPRGLLWPARGDRDRPPRRAPDRDLPSGCGEDGPGPGLTRLEDTLGEAAFQKALDELEEQRWTLDPD